MLFEITIGWTQGGYDGWRPELFQHFETVEVEWTNPPVLADEAILEMAREMGLDPNAHLAERIANTLLEACFEATNSPFPLEGLPRQIASKIQDAGYYGEQAGHYSLSVGDTITIGETTWACARFGWEVVYNPLSIG